MSHTKSTGRTFLLALLTLVWPCFEAFAETNSIMLFPLTIHAESSMDYIQTGVADLMETKLTENQIPISRAPSAAARKDAIDQAKAQNMETLIMGSLTFLGDSISISIKLISSETGENLLVFSKVESDKSKLFNDISEFITQVVDQRPPEPSAEAVAVPEPLPEPSPKPDEAPSGLSQDIIRSEDIKMEAAAISVGDVDGDGKKEIILADKNSLTIFEFQNGSCTKSGQIDGPSYLNILHVTTFDTDKNGRDEIIVSAVHAKNGNVSSYAYTFNGSAYTLLCKNMDWFFKTGSCPFSTESTLLGQQQQFSDNSFFRDVWTITWDNDKKTLTSVDPCANPIETINLFNYATGKLLHTDEILTVSYIAGDYLSMFKSDKEEVWSSSERLGGSNLYINAKEQSPPERHYLTPRIETGDFNGDGNIDVVTLINKNSTPRMFANMRKYVEGQVVCMSWKTLDFETLWTSAKIPGYIPDFTITDLTGDGILDLIYCVIPKKSSFFAKKKSYIVVQPIIKSDP